MNERADLRDDIESMEVKPNVIITTYTLASKKDDTKFLRRLKPCVSNYHSCRGLLPRLTLIGVRF